MSAFDIFATELECVMRQCGNNNASTVAREVLSRSPIPYTIAVWTDGYIANPSEHPGHPCVIINMMALAKDAFTREGK